MIRGYNDEEPDIADSAYVDPQATIIGDVTIGPDATILPGAVLRGDGGEIVLEAKANVQDNVTIHADEPTYQVVLEENAAVGHNAIVHNATIGEHSLVGMHATVLDDAVLEPYSAVAAKTLVMEDQTIPSYTMAGGRPAETIKEDLPEDSMLFQAAEFYVERAKGLEAGRIIEE
ncbi:gamma carbonic anhydrase family protein [Halovenus sp. WSH3]|uniref:Gamma carbonic anhydrase family protein n=1 Tax=Halovenus carboxidivorans TaxID=2692199 RepID=A0A6B0TCU4_9EURY|nr:gamma carbonic anhydrase family protein [Halovenus carboxidivorans]MXR51019.1 gamma carbonic anhydrase family protein [Halovenus carboxidivorans]